MTDNALPILACGSVDLGPTSAEQLTDLREMLKASIAKPPRRLSRFIQLAMIGAARCVGSRQLPPDTNIYLTSGSGDFDVTFEVLERVLRDRQAPKPLSFINTVSNAACFYLTKQFDLHGASTFVSRRCFALESAFSQALLDAYGAGQTSSLVGSADVLTIPLDIHAARLGVSADEPLAEGAHWFLLSRSQDDSACLGWLEDVRYYRDIDEACSVLESLKASNETPTLIAKGYWMSDASFTSLQSASDAGVFVPHLSPSGFYETASGLTISDFLGREDCKGHRLVHAQVDEAGRVCLLTIRR
ncbi:MAG: hypothetical protein CME88_06885 [Hirschia sp.]|nr:hypothetical protein [Hirschia sp.]MBF18086.1 hypothetical protein [Hirschia sp.]|tara:strand:+ start:153 stop:1058 length:906 start_codon:yes stop_codon:yes gene_type:complete